MAIMMMVIEALWVFRKTDGRVYVETYEAWLSELMLDVVTALGLLLG